MFDEAVGNTDNMLLVFREEHDIHTSEVLDADTLYHRDDVKENYPRRLYKESILYGKLIRTIFMTEIQLKNIVDRMGADPDTKTDGDSAY